MDNIYNLFSDIDHFLNKVAHALTRKGMDFDKLNPDHICYRVDSLDRYYGWSYKLRPISKLLSNNNINGRPISVFKLKKPIIYAKKKIYVFELPAPKLLLTREQMRYTEGFEHVEFVIDVPFGDFVNQYPHVNFDLTNANKPINPGISLHFDKGRINLKFHLKSLEEIIKTEQ